MLRMMSDWGFGREHDWLFDNPDNLSVTVLVHEEISAARTTARLGSRRLTACRFRWGFGARMEDSQ